MSFSPEQTKLLSAGLIQANVKTREQGGRDVSYIEGWHVIAEANRIFGFDNWTRETTDIRCVSEKERPVGRDKAAGWGVTYICKVKIVAFAGDALVTREGCGAGHGIDRDLGQAHESAIKEAETDAMKRALMTFGNPFGLALYDKTQSNVVNESDESRRRFVEECENKIRAYMDAKELRLWWASEEQKNARRDFELGRLDIEQLMAIIKTKLEQLEGKKAA
jgi:DNA repair and recombination protein RAD52